MVARFSEADKAVIWEMREAGVPVKRIAKHLGRQNSSLRKFIADAGGRRPSPRERSRLRLSLAEREEVSRGLAAGSSLRAIAAGLGRSPSTVCREVNANGGPGAYRALRGGSGRAAAGVASPPGEAGAVPTVAARGGTQARGDLVTRADLGVVGFGVSRRPGDAGVSRDHLPVAVRAGPGRVAPRAALLSAVGAGVAPRKAYTKGGVGQGQLRDMVMISERPAEAADRAVPGHWEGDLIFGKKMTAIATLVERRSRYVILCKLPNGHSAEAVRAALAKRIVSLPAHLRRSLTWDQGKEMAQHAQFTVDTGVQVYFCDPKSPWQRGTNENTNGLLRQFLPKSSDLSQPSQQQLNAIARKLNGRPRQTLRWMTPSQAFAQDVALTG